MNKLKVVEKFVSIDGEGPMAGGLATFIRFAGCNLRCSWCDTSYSWEEKEDTEQFTADEIYQYIKQTGVKHVTLTGGEPLIHDGIKELLLLLNQEESLLVHIETNGSIPIQSFQQLFQNDRVRYIVDYKLSDSNMTGKMAMENLMSVTKKDVYKFVIASQNDLLEAKKIIEQYQLDDRCMVYFSPVLGQIDPQVIVEFMKEHQLGNVKLQLQLHKFIWPKESRGV